MNAAKVEFRDHMLPLGLARFLAAFAIAASLAGPAAAEGRWLPMPETGIAPPGEGICDRLLAEMAGAALVLACYATFTGPCLDLTCPFFDPVAVAPDDLRTALAEGLPPDFRARPGAPTLLHRMLFREVDPEILVLLTQAGADVTEVNGQGMPVLMSAMLRRVSPEGIGVLLAAGADPNRVWVEGYDTPFGFFLGYGAGSPEQDAAMSALMARYGADLGTTVPTRMGGVTFMINSALVGGLEGTEARILAAIAAGARFSPRPGPVLEMPLSVAIHAGRSPELISAMLGAGMEPCLVADRARWESLGYEIWWERMSQGPLQTALAQEPDLLAKLLETRGLCSEPTPDEP